MVSKITDVHAREVLDSRGNPTVEVDLTIDNTHTGRFIVPSGASTGEYESVEMRDGGERYLGKGVQQAVRNVNSIIKPKILGYDPSEQENLDKLMIELDGTDNKSKLGANSILGVSIANIKATAKLLDKPVYQYVGQNNRLPCPMLNVINGGKHAGGELAIQEFMIMPIGFNSFSRAIRAGVEVYHSLKKYLKSKYGGNAINVGDEGGFAPPIDRSSDAIEALISSISDAGYKPMEEFYIGLDAAASEFYNNNKYHIDGKDLTPEEMIEYYQELIESYPILLSIEDPFDENDFSSFSELVRLNPDKSIVGDDLTVTNSKRIQTAIENNSMNYLLLKVNQIGTYTEAKSAFDLTKKQDWGVVISHRSGETEDTFISDLAVGWGAERIKTGAPARSERVAKYNQLLRIEESLDSKASYYNQTA